MTVYIACQPFPHPNMTAGQDGAMAMIDGETFDIVCYISYPSKREIDAFMRGKLRYGSFIKYDIPFLLLWFAGVAMYDCPINIVKLKRPEGLQRFDMFGDYFQ